MQFITDYAVRPNNVSDKVIFGDWIEKIKENTGCTDMYVDGAYHSNDVYEFA